MKVLVIASLAYSLTNFRRALLARLVADGHQVIACAPDEDSAVSTQLSAMGVQYRRIPMARAGLDPIQDLRTLTSLIALLRTEKPDGLLAYTQKPIIYAGLAAQITGVPRFIPMITGLGYVFTGAGRRPWLRRLVSGLYRLAIRRATVVIVFNRDDREEMRRQRILHERHEVTIVPGSGVDIAHFSPQAVPSGPPVFLLIARVLRDKGLSEFIAAAEIVKRHHSSVRFQLLGPFDPNPAAIQEAELKDWVRRGVVEYLGETRDVRPHLAACTAYVLPSYREGMPRTVLEAMATGRAIITTDAPGCRETVVPGHNGFLVPVGDAEALAEAMLRFVEDPALAARMGTKSRRIAESLYAVENVTEALLKAMGLGFRSPQPAAQDSVSVQTPSGPGAYGIQPSRPGQKVMISGD